MLQIGHVFSLRQVLDSHLMRVYNIDIVMLQIGRVFSLRQVLGSHRWQHLLRVHNKDIVMLQIGRVFSLRQVLDSHLMREYNKDIVMLQIGRVFSLRQVLGSHRWQHLLRVYNKDIVMLQIGRVFSLRQVWATHHRCRVQHVEQRPLASVCLRLGGAGEIKEGKLAEEVILTNLSTRIRLAFSATCFLCNKSFRHIADALSWGCTINTLLCYRMDVCFLSDKSLRHTANSISRRVSSNGTTFHPIFFPEGKRQRHFFLGHHIILWYKMVQDLIKWCDNTKHKDIHDCIWKRYYTSDIVAPSVSLVLTRMCRSKIPSPNEMFTVLTRCLGWRHARTVVGTVLPIHTEEGRPIELLTQGL